MQHLDEGTIHAWLDGALPSAEAAHVEAHAASCAECAARIAEARGLIAGSSRIVASLDIVPAKVIPMPPTSARESLSLWRNLGLTPSRAAIAALLLVGIASMFSVRHQSTPRGVPMGTVVQDPPPHILESTPAPEKTLAQPKRAAQRVDTVSVAKAPPPASPAVSAATPTPTPAPTPPAPAAARKAPFLAEVVTTSVAAAEAKARVDTVDVRDRVNADAPVTTRRLYTNGANAASGATAFAMRNVSLEGCYSIPDSVRRQTPQLPTGYALQQDSLGAHIVRALNTLNRPDSVIVGATWLVLAPTSVIVQSRLNDRPSAILLGPSRRVDCRP